LQTLHLPENEYAKQLKSVLDKECLCIGLSNAAAINYDITFLKKLNAVNICPGPNIVNFTQEVSLQTMVNHIYGRENILQVANRPNMFIAELYLYVDYLKELLQSTTEPDVKTKKYNALFFHNMMAGIGYYRELFNEANTKNAAFIDALNHVVIELDSLDYQYDIIE
jgi:hypothetical protein